MQGVGHEVAMSYFVFLASTPNCKRFNNCKSPPFHEQGLPFEPFEPIAIRVEIRKQLFARSGGELKIELSKKRKAQSWALLLASPTRGDSY